MGNMHIILQELEQEAIDKIKIRRMMIVRDNKEYHFRCDIAEWNWFLGRYYPKAELMFMVTHYERMFSIKINQKL